MLGKYYHKVSSKAKKKHKEQPAAMVPLFSLRSLIMLSSGFLVGALLGLGYFIVSPSLTTAKPAAAAASRGIAGSFVSSSGPWTTEVEVQLVDPGPSYTPLNELQRRGQYYATKANSLPFLEFLSQQLSEQAPQYACTVDELDQMMTVDLERRYEGEPPTIEIRVTTPTVDEGLFFVGFVPEVFREFLTAEENKTQQQSHQRVLAEIESVKKAILEAEQELAVLTKEGTASGIDKDPTYIALTARIEALQLEVTRLAAEIAAPEQTEATSEEYERTLQEREALITSALSEAKEELNTVMQKKASNDIRNNPEYITLNARIISLDLELERNMTELATLIAEDVTGTRRTRAEAAVQRASTALAEAKKDLDMLEAQIDVADVTQNLDYQLVRDKITRLNNELTDVRLKLASFRNQRDGGKGYQGDEAALRRTSMALSKAREELAVLQSQTDADRLAENLDYRVAKTKVDNLNNKLATLNDKLSATLVRDVDKPVAADYLAVRNPSMPSPVLPMRLRDALLIGAIVGIGGTWVALNFRWLISGLLSSPEKQEEEGEET